MRKLALVTAFALAFADVAFSQGRSQRSVLFHWENDSLGSIAGEATDENYTNGLRLDIGSPGPHRWADGIESLYRRTFGVCSGEDRCKQVVSYGFTHQFYTPRRIQDPRPQPRERPWAGLMYLSATLRLNDGENQQHVLEGQLGILGQGAGAQYLQSRWHQAISYPVEPLAWQPGKAGG
jgi:lipid A 3-O-deacylase